MAKLIRFYDTATGEERGITYIGDADSPVYDKSWSYEIVPESRKMELIELHRQQVDDKYTQKTQKQIILETIGLTEQDVQKIKSLK